MTTRTRRSLTLALLVALLHVVAIGSPAHADPDRLRLSLSPAGPFTESLTTPLFSGSYVPGTATSRFWVKNDSPSTTRVTIALVRVPDGDDTDLEPWLSFSASIGGESGGLVEYVSRKKNECSVIYTGPTLAPRDKQPVDVHLHFAPDPPESGGMNGSANYSFVVTLSQVTNKGKVNVCGPQSPGGSQSVQSVQVLGAMAPGQSTPPLAPASSGAVRSTGFVAGFAVGVLGAGALLLLGARRRREDEPVESPSS